ncbi:MAG: GNAT family N-acetyltransferase [Pseudopedobacter saltans]|uniref:GNAT family N-acetyltransferase n=1 Tax=Pseudopedobacter saltans TaxID=151895 RepID=A0A2W5EH69_9SPHI|nr:MAG: GNAT family N-acetyltransferase [Pseudopedobacter saltans]
MENIEIKRAFIGDIEKLQKIGRSTFVETFAGDNTKENMANYLEKGFSLEKLRLELQDPCSEIFFAQKEDLIIGYLKLNFGNSQTERQQDDALEIERIYVLKAFHGLKVGQLLYEKTVDIATERKIRYIWLGVWEKNARAIHFYQKNGFKEFDKHIFQLGSEAQTDIMMKLELV